MLPLVELRRVRAPHLAGEITLSLFPGEALLLQGENGSGKTALLRLLAGETAPLAGQRLYGLAGSAHTSAVRARQRFYLVGPDSEAALLLRPWPQPVRGVLLGALAGDEWQGEGAAAEQRLQEVAALTHIQALLGRDFRPLSHGQRRRVMLARALMPRPELLLLDEFTDGLSPGAISELGAVLRAVHAAGTALVLATHRPDEVPDLGWRVLQLAAGQAVEAPAGRAARPDLRLNITLPAPFPQPAAPYFR